jgi:hypothetical protein
MNEISRRDVVGAAALAGAVALAGLSPGRAAAEDKPKPEFDEKKEKEHVMSVGLSEAEADCWIAVAKAAGSFFELPKLHPMDDQEVAQAIHVIQHKLLSRPAYRKYKGLDRGEKK